MNFTDLPAVPEGMRVGYCLSETTGIVPVLVCFQQEDGQHVVHELMRGEDACAWDDRFLVAELCWLGKVYDTPESAADDGLEAIKRGLGYARDAVTKADDEYRAHCNRAAAFRKWRDGVKA